MAQVIICQNTKQIHYWLHKHGNGFVYLMLEIAHVLVFLMALIFSIIILLVNTSVRSPPPT